MKKVVAFLFIVLLAAGGYFTWVTLNEVSPDNVAQVSISNPSSGYAETFSPDDLDMTHLLDDLSGRPVDFIQQEEYSSFEFVITNTWGTEKSYTAYFSKSERQVFVKDHADEEIRLVENPAFLSVHELFDDLYNYRVPPHIEWSSSLDSFRVGSEKLEWQYEKWDGSWHESETGALSPDKIEDTIYTTPSTDIAIFFDSDYDPDSARVELSEAGDVLLEQELTGNLLPVMDKEGTYTYRIWLDWEGDNKPYTGSYSCGFVLNIDIPPAFEVANRQVAQGEVIEVRAFHVNDDEEPFMEQSLTDKFRFFKDDEGYVGFIPTGYYTSPGEYNLVFSVNGEHVITETVTVEPRDFHIQYLYIDEEVESSTRNDEAYAEYDKYFWPVRFTSADQAYYSEPFVIPAYGRLSTEYGETRYVNNSPTSYRHSGLDIGTPTGEPVYAANDGLVVLSRHLIMTGYTIVIDHGLGLFSVYFHMDELMVEPDEMVEKGQQIGKIGSTGFSTGPHLHFTMSYYETNIEPGYILVGEPITYENYKLYLE